MNLTFGGILFAVGGAFVFASAFMFTLSVIDNGFEAAFHTVLRFLVP
jgi:hypothetical protein